MADSDEKITDDKRKAFSDEVLWRAMTLMQEQGVPVEMIVDRVLTAGAAHLVRGVGEREASRVFLHVAAQIDAGVFSKVARPSGVH